MVTKTNQVQFYSEELRELEFSVKNLFNSIGLSLFQNGGLYIGQYKGLDEKRGNVFVDIPIGKGHFSPRLEQTLTCFTLKKGLERPSSWTNTTYSDLLKDRNWTEIKIVDYTPSKREGWITMLIRKMDEDFIETLVHNQILAFGPTIPPFEYLQNLKEFSRSFNEDDNTIWSKILGFKYQLNKSKQPRLLTEDCDIASTIIKEVDKCTIYIFQGPPGTGKTHQIADVVSRLVLDNHSVLITALTNKAAIEVCEKSFFNRLFAENRVSKLPISIDERKKFPELLNAKELVSKKGHLTLTTFYQFSRIWKEQTQTFDYVIVEEASQAYLTTIAAACKVGKKVIVVGDPKQIVPIVTNKNYQTFSNIDELINGMKTLSQIDEFSSNRKVETRRLTSRSTAYTNCFYQNSIKSKSLFTDISEDINRLNTLSRFTHPNGGPSLIIFQKGNTIYMMMQFLIVSLDELSNLKGNDIAVLTPYVDTLTYLQQNLKSKTRSRNYLIESVDRVQGLDVDYCFYVIPKPSSFSFNLNRFNVATSRAKKCTFILAEQDFDHVVNLPSEVAIYLSKLKDEFSFSFPYNQGENSNNNNLTVNEASDIIESIEVSKKADESLNDNKGANEKVPSLGIGLKVVGQIDVSKFQKLKKELKNDKQNLYIIDTNVFIDCPDIISKIDSKYPIILSAKVLDELDKLKSTLDDQGKMSVQRALKSINRNIDTRDLRMEVADLSLLPIDFNKRSPDNFIFSVVLKFKDENPILLTSDNGLQIKAKGLGITTITLREYLKR